MKGRHFRSHCYVNAISCHVSTHARSPTAETQLEAQYRLQHPYCIFALDGSILLKWILHILRVILT
jgi:hypothetical protein